MILGFTSVVKRQREGTITFSRGILTAFGHSLVFQDTQKFLTLEQVGWALDARMSAYHLAEQAR